MTTVIASIQDDRVYIGADSQATMNFGSSYQKARVRHSKIMKVGPFVVAPTGSYRLVNILAMLQADIPPFSYADDPLHNIMVGFIKPLRAALKEAGQYGVDSSGMEDTRSDMLLAYNGGLYYVGSDFHVFQNADNLYTGGSGERYALGAMKALQDEYAPIRILHALEIAAYFDAGTSAPFEVVYVTQNGEIVPVLPITSATPDFAMALFS